jgi:predicted DNA-binding protein YlxM (UPF0122 family)
MRIKNTKRKGHVHFTALTVEQRREVASLYLDKKMSTIEIADLFEVSYRTICNQLEMMGIKRRNPILAVKNRQRNKRGPYERKLS